MSPDIPDRIDLWDYSAVAWRPGEKEADRDGNEALVQFCKDLQDAINRDDSAIFRLDTGVVEDDSDDDEEDKKKTSVFIDEGKRVNKYAGILAFQGKTVVIHSRFDHSRKDYFLSYALRRLWPSIPAKGSDKLAPPAAAGTMELLLPRVFLETLASACDVGLYRQYQTVLYNDSSPRGRIDIARHIRLNPMENGRVAYSSRVYTIDNPINRLILAAYATLRGKCGGEVERLLRSNSRLRQPVQALSEQLGSVDLSPASIRQLIHQADAPITHPMHRRYETLRRMSIMILRAEGMDLFSRTELRAAGILIPMDRVWERLLESLFPEGVLTAQKKFDILQGGRVLKPDLLLPGAVFDGKYRLPWTRTYDDIKKHYDPNNGLRPWRRDGIRADVFQVLSYMYVFRCSTGGVIFPWPGDDPELEPLRVYISKYSAQIPEDRRGEEDFWLMPFPIPTEAASQAEFDRRMEENGNNFAKWMNPFLKRPEDDQAVTEPEHSQATTEAETDQAVIEPEIRQAAAHERGTPMEFYQGVYHALGGGGAVPESAALVLSSRAAGRRLLAAVAAECGMLVGVSAETPYSLAAELCAPRLMEPGAPRLMDDNEAAELLMGCVMSGQGLFSKEKAGTLAAVREIARSLRELDMEKVPPLTQAGKQAELQALRAAYAAEKKRQNCWDRADLFAAAIELADAAPKTRCVTLPGLRFTALETELLTRLSEGGLQYAPLETPQGLRSPYLAPEGGYPEVLDRRNADNTRILACMGEELEAERVLRDMLERGRSFDRCALVYPSASYAPMLYETAGRLGIPVAFPSGVPVAETRVYAALRLLSRLRRRFNEAEDLRKLLVDFGMSDKAPYELARRLREYRVGWGDKAHYLDFIAEYRKDTEKKETLTEEQKALRRVNSENWEKWLEAVFTLSEPPKGATLAAQKEAMALFLSGGRANALERAATFTAAELARHVRTLPDGSRLVDWLLELLEGKSVLTENAAPGKLLCLPLRQALSCGREHIYVLGLGRDVFEPGVESPVLLDAERRALNEAFGCTLPLRQSAGEEKRLRFLELLLHHEGELVLSYSNFNCDKQIFLLPTQIVDALVRREDPIPLEKHTFLPKAGAKVLAATDVFLKDAWTECSPPKPRKHGDGSPAELKEEQDMAAMLSEYVFSASSMETALHCPLQFYYNNLLRARKPEYPIWKTSEWLPKNILGTFCHKVLELYFREQINTPEMDADASARLLARIFDQEWKQVKRRNPPPGRLEEKTKAAALEMIQKAVRWTEAEKRRVLATERDFGPGKKDKELTLRAGTQSFKLQGSIDRVDQKQDDSYSVVDYKTGDPERLERQKAYHLQHYLYKEAEKALSEGEITPAEAGYLLLGDDACRFFTRDEAADKVAEKAVEEMLTKLKTDSSLFLKGALWKVADDGTLLDREGPEALEEFKQCGNYCSYRDLCPLASEENKKGGGGA